MSNRLLAAFSAIAGLLTVTAAQAAQCPAPGMLRFQIAAKIHRDYQGFTEGLEMQGGALYESTGPLFGSTRLNRITPDGHVTVLDDLGDKFFGEGLTVFHNQIYQLSWKEHLVSVYDLKGKLLRTLNNSHDGWGLTHDATRLIFTDGGDRLYFADPANFRITASLPIRAGAEAVDSVNELEYADGAIYANVFLTREILKIDPATGCVLARGAMDNLWAAMTVAERQDTAQDENFVLNGIAHDPASGRFILTGKDWPVLFSGRFVAGGKAP